MDIGAFQALSNRTHSGAAAAAKASTSSRSESGFGDVIKGFIEEVNDLQINAQGAQEQLLRGNVQDLRQVVVAMSKADVAFRYMRENRSKLVDAYQEVMRTSV